LTVPLDLDALRQWVGRTETVCDTLTPRLAAAYAATVQDRELAPLPGDPAPAGIHWCLAPAIVPMSGLGEDGHPRRGGFLPPVPLPRRMWAGSRISFGAALPVGAEVERRSTVADIRLKEGRSGPLCFVTLVHIYSTADGVAVQEEQDVVYLGAQPSETAAAAQAAQPASATPVLTLRLEPSTTLLFRFSALTFNSHRIHYDAPYARAVENHPALVVHGPLQAALLLDLACRMRGGAAPSRFECRTRRPLYIGDPLGLNGAWSADRTAELWTGEDAGRPFLTARADWQ